MGQTGWPVYDPNPFKAKPNSIINLGFVSGSRVTVHFDSSNYIQNVSNLNNNKRMRGDDGISNFSVISGLTWTVYARFQTWQWSSIEGGGGTVKIAVAGKIMVGSKIPVERTMKFEQ